MVHRFLPKWAGATALALSSALSPPAAAFCRTTTCSVVNPPAFCVRDAVTQCHNFGAPLFWDDVCVAYSIHESGSPKLGLGYAETEAMVTSALAVWPRADCAPGFPTISTILFGPTSCGRAEFNRQGPNANTIMFQDLDWSHQPAQIGVTTVSFDTASGRILGADIEVNTFGYQLTTLQAKFIVMHEGGHFFGLDHSPDPTAVMYAQYDFAAGEPMLAPDDIAAICSAYPTTRRDPVCQPQPHRGYATDCGGDVEGGCATELGQVTSGSGSAAVLILAVACVARRRKRLRRGKHRSERA